MNDNHELRGDGERDTKEYKKKCEEQRRESFVFRNAKGVRHRLDKEENDANNLCKKHERYVLKRAGINVTEEYKKKCEEQRRERFAFGNDECVRQRLEKEKGSMVNTDRFEERDKENNEYVVDNKVVSVAEKRRDIKNNSKIIATTKRIGKHKIVADVIQKKIKKRKRIKEMIINNGNIWKKMGKERHTRENIIQNIIKRNTVEIVVQNYVE